MDYYKIGQRIRKFRKAQGLSQEDLAERVNISTTHMSHIETGNTKLSLQVFSDISDALEVSTDLLLRDEAHNQKSTAIDQINAVLERCTGPETSMIAEIIKTTKTALEKYI